MRRARRGVLDRPVDAQGALAFDGFAEPKGKAPRVFRLETARSVATPPAAVPTLPAVVKRQRRIAADKRPGQVLHVVHIQPQQPKTAAAAGSVLLSDELARLAPVMEAIQRAQSFWVVDERFEQEWQRLSKQADQLLLQLHAYRR